MPRQQMRGESGNQSTESIMTDANQNPDPTGNPSDGYPPTRPGAIAAPAWIEGWRSPVLLIHGDDDRNVPFAQTVALLTALRAKGVEVEEIVFPDEIHDFLLHSHWLAAYHAAVDFFDRRLKPR
jgi:acetyl esterase/lipase